VLNGLYIMNRLEAVEWIIIGAEKRY